MDKKKSVFDENVKRFSASFVGLFVNMCVSMAIAILVHIVYMLLLR